MKAVIIYKRLDNKVFGVFEETNGTFLAMTFTKSKAFKTMNGAKRWIEKFL